MRGTERGQFVGFPATGKTVEMPGIHVLRIADGRIAANWRINDDLGQIRLLAAIPT